MKTTTKTTTSELCELCGRKMLKTHPKSVLHARMRNACCKLIIEKRPRVDVKAIAKKNDHTLARMVLGLTHRKSVRSAVGIKYGA